MAARIWPIAISAVDLNLDGTTDLAVLNRASRTVTILAGNGTAFTFEHDDSVFTFSIHQESNYPSIKPRGSLDVGLPDLDGRAAHFFSS